MSPRPSQPLRLLIAIALVLAVATLMLTLLGAADSALSVWQRLQQLPGWMSWVYGVMLCLLSVAAGWAVWRLLHPRASRTPRAAPIDRTAIEQRIERLGDQNDAARTARSELLELDERRAGACVQVALFGEISAGKSSLLNALAPQADAAVGARGGTTTTVVRHRGILDAGIALEVADVPGTLEAGGAAHAALARAEAARSHALLFVVDGDVTRAQDAELRALAGFGRPLLLLLNKLDRYEEAQRNALLTTLQQRYAALGVQVFGVHAGHEEEITREWPDGRRERIMRHVGAELGALPRALERLARIGAERFEPGREAALLAHVDAALAQGEREQRAERSEATVARYTRRAIVGAMAAIAPGTDLIIQGALATAMLRELCTIHELSIRDVDLDGFLARAGGLVRTTTSVTLAVAGNALKAFPGLGTLGGGLLHAVAYGLIFDSLGRAVAETLANTASLDREATLHAFRDRLQAPAAERMRQLAGLALDAWRDRGHVDATTSPPSSSGTGTREP